MIKAQASPILVTIANPFLCRAETLAYALIRRRSREG
jgi:hypothetical protein